MKKFFLGCQWFFVGLLFGLAIVSSKAADPWTTTDKALGTVALLATVVDWGQTRHIAKHPERFRETNPMLGEHPSVSDVNRHFAIAIVGGGLIAHFLPGEIRPWFLGGAAVVEIGFGINNASLGIKMDFK